METSLYGTRAFSAVQVRDLLAAERKGRNGIRGTAKDVVEARIPPRTLSKRVSRRLVMGYKGAHNLF
jgi:hypothetical protein